LKAFEHKKSLDKFDYDSLFDLFIEIFKHIFGKKLEETRKVLRIVSTIVAYLPINVQN
jgi:hypothetical protein